MSTVKELNVETLEAKKITLDLNGVKEDRAKKAIKAAKKAQDKEERINEYTESFDFNQMVNKLAKMVVVRQDAQNIKTLAHWYDKNIREYKSPLFIFNQIAKGGKENPFNKPKKKLVEFEISTKKLNGINLISMLPLDIIVKQVILQGNYSPSMIKTAFTATNKAKVWNSKQAIKKMFDRSQAINKLIEDYRKGKTDIQTFIKGLVAEYPNKDAKTDEFKKAVSTMVVTLEMQAETKAKKDTEKATANA